ncbi:methyltransferase domain-containing protein [Propionivibrio sp.]|uniref:methyltransferase domain-containing protein n=1 Tax=Propionivibrio sp. TaxID=2212460 RepID=UPI003BF01C21
MADIYNTIASAEPAVAERIAEVLEVRATDPQQRRMLDAYLAEIDFPENARVLEIGCGTGAVARRLAAWPNVGKTVGLDPSPVFIEQAEKLSVAHENLSFRQGCAHQPPFADDSFDVIIFHTTLCHLSDPQNALHQTWHLLRPGGWLAVFDGDYASTTFGTGDLDPLQICAESFREHFIADSWIGRLTPNLAKQSGFAVNSFRSHGYTESSSPNYLLTIVDRGAEALATARQIGEALAQALKDEARRRVEQHRFFGHITYTSLIARKPVH